MTCAGGTGGIDLMLSLIGEKHGEKLTAEICDQMVHPTARHAEQSQRAAIGHGIDSPLQGVIDAVDLIDTHVSEPLKVPEIAQHVGLSQRQLERQFHKAMGCSIVQFSLLTRLQRARVLLISTDLTVREVSADCGFNSLSHFAYAFRKCFGKRPSDYRQAWPEHEDEPYWPGALGRYLDTARVQRRIEESAGRTSK